jgi:DNA-binding HxlR family transcriptional regulator
VAKSNHHLPLKLPVGEDSPQSAAPTKCPLTTAITAIGGKWNLICLYWLDSGTRRFNELRRLMPDISHKVLTSTLRTLEREGLIRRTVYAEVPSRVEYSISAHGETVRPIIQAVRAWGHEHIAAKSQAQFEASSHSVPRPRRTRKSEHHPRPSLATNV